LSQHPELKEDALDRFSEQQRHTACLLALHRTPGVGPATFQRLLEQFPRLDSLFAKPSVAKLTDSIQQCLSNVDWDQIEADLDWLVGDNRHLISIDDERYPELLRQIADPPGLLFAQGDVELLQSWQIAIVGSRNPTASGKSTAYDFSQYLAEGGLTITSGLALGIDAAAHKGALAAQGKTIAVVATGLDRVYPAQHRELAHSIAESGLIISEFPLGTSPRAEFFPRRNRLISGLSLGTLVVEAAPKSGSLITARMAMEQAREVFAIPGSIHNPLSRGCHQLIRQGAKLVETANDIIEELGALAGVTAELASQQAVSAVEHELDADYQNLFEYLGFDPITVDDLIENSGLTADVVSSMLLLLELQGQVESLPGGRFVRTGSVKPS
jgi:DNA processing protein